MGFRPGKRGADLIGASHIARLFGRARGAGMSLLLATQEFADLEAAGQALCDQVVGNLDALIAHRQNVPGSAEFVADVAGSTAGWITTQGTEQGLLGQRASGRGTRRRDYEREIHPALIQRLGVGEAVVVDMKAKKGRAAGGKYVSILQPPSRSVRNSR